MPPFTAKSFDDEHSSHGFARNTDLHFVLIVTCARADIRNCECHSEILELAARNRGIRYIAPRSCSLINCYRKSIRRATLGHGIADIAVAMHPIREVSCRSLASIRGKRFSPLATEKRSRYCATCHLDFHRRRRRFTIYPPATFLPPPPVRLQDQHVAAAPPRGRASTFRWRLTIQ